MSNSNDSNDSNESIDISKEFLITTIDNPFNPFKEFDEWYKFDTTYGYNTYQKLVTLGNFDDDLSEQELAIEYEKAMEELLKIHPMYIKVTNDDNTSDRIKKLRENLLEHAKSIDI